MTELFDFAFFDTVVEVFKTLHCDCKAVCKTLFVEVVVSVVNGVIVVFENVVESGDAGRTETCLCKRCTVGCSAERRNHTLVAVDAELICRFHEGVGNFFVRFDGAVQVAIVDHEELRIVNGIEGIDPSGNVVEFAFVCFAPCFRTAETCFFGTGEDDADFGVFEDDAFVVECLKDCNRDKASGKVVVCAVDDGLFIPHEVHTDFEGDEDKGCYANPEERTVCSRTCDTGFASSDDGCRDAACELKECADNGDDDMRFIDCAAELAVDGPVPRCVGVTVEENSAFDFAGAFLDGGDVGAFLFGEEEVNEFLVKTELQDHGKETECKKNDAYDRDEEEGYRGKNRAGERDINPSEEGAGVFLVVFNVGAFATALIFENACHIFASNFLAFRTGTTFRHVLADMCDFADHIICMGIFLFDDFR